DAWVGPTLRPAVSPDAPGDRPGAQGTTTLSPGGAITMSRTTDDPRPPVAADARTRIGFIGLGAMGSRIAGRLLDAGHPVSATKRTAANAQPLIERGLACLSTAREVAASTDVLLSMVTDDEALEAITTGPQGLLAGLEPGQV